MKKIFLILSLFLVQTCIVNAQQIPYDFVGKVSTYQVARIAALKHRAEYDSKSQFAQLTLTGAGKNKSGGAPPGGCTEATNWITRALVADAAYDATHQSQDTTFICYLVNNSSTWASLGAIWVPANEDHTGATTDNVAKLNLNSSSFTLSNNGATFTANQGYTGTDSSTTIYVGTSYTLATSGSDTQNSIHMSCWCDTPSASGASGGMAMGVLNGGAVQTELIPRATGNVAYFRVNDANPFSLGVSNSLTTGHYLGSRNGATSADQQAYINAVAQTLALTVASAAPYTGGQFILLAGNNANTVINGFGGTVKIASVGPLFSSAQTTVLCHASNVLLAARSGIAGGLC